MALAAKIPFRHPYAAGFPGLGSQPMPTDVDALDYLDRMSAADGASVEVGVATAVDAFFRDSKAAGVFDALKACCILAGARTLAGALVPVVGDAPTNVANGFVEGDFSRTSGLTGDGTSYIDSGRAGDDDPLNDAHLAVHVSESATSNTHYKAGAYNSGTQQTILRSNFGSFLSAVNSGNFASAGGGNDVGLFGASRFAADSSEFRLLGVTTPDSTASGAASTQNVTIFARNDGTPDGFFDGTIAFYSIGESLSLEDLDTAVSNLINRLKFAILVGENPSGLDPDTIDYIVRGYEAGGTLE